MPVHHLRIHTESVHVALAVDLPNDTLVIVVPERATQLVITHISLVFMFPPPDCNGFWLMQTKLPLSDVGSPFDEILVLGITEKSIEELPQLHASFSWWEREGEKAVIRAVSSTKRCLYQIE